MRKFIALSAVCASAIGLAACDNIGREEAYIGGGAAAGTAAGAALGGSAGSAALGGLAGAGAGYAAEELTEGEDDLFD